MLRRICEKCGATIEKPRQRNFVYFKPWYVEVRFFKSNDQCFETTIDLCNRCRDLFDKWLEEPPKGERI